MILNERKYNIIYINLRIDINYINLREYYTQFYLDKNIPTTLFQTAIKF